MIFNTLRVQAFRQNWIKKHNPPLNPQYLHSHRIYILPSAFGLLYGFIMLSITIGAINYQLNTAYFFVFLLFTAGLLSLWQTHQNLKEITISCLPIPDVEEGQPAKITLLIEGQPLVRYGLVFSHKQCGEIKVDEVPLRGEKVVIPLETHARGQFIIPLIKIYSYFPMGLFRVWSYLDFNSEYYVYPAARSPGFWPLKFAENTDIDNPIHLLGDDELYELTTVNNPWVQASRIAWKASARGQGWYLKTLTSPAGEHWLFRLSDLPSYVDLEQSLQYLSYWIQTAERQNQTYALELKNIKTEYAHGEEHMKKCLRMLALFKA